MDVEANVEAVSQGLKSTVDVAETQSAEKFDIYNAQTSFITKMECLPMLETCAEDTFDDIPEEPNFTTQH